MKRYLTFDLDECYALDMDLVAEVIQSKPVTPVPETPAYIAGVINLRGAVIPVIDMRARFLKEQREDLLRRCILIISFGEMMIGLLVDDNADITELDPEQLAAPPQVGNHYSHVFIKSIGMTEGKVILVIDTDKLVHLEEINAMDIGETRAENEG